MYTDGILSANIFRSHNGSYVFFTHIPQRPLQIVPSFLEFGKVLPKEHSLADGCLTNDAKGREFTGLEFVRGKVFDPGRAASTRSSLIHEGENKVKSFLWYQALRPQT